MVVPPGMLVIIDAPVDFQRLLHGNLRGDHIGGDRDEAAAFVFQDQIGERELRRVGVPARRLRAADVPAVQKIALVDAQRRERHGVCAVLPGHDLGPGGGIRVVVPPGMLVIIDAPVDSQRLLHGDVLKNRSEADICLVDVKIGNTCGFEGSKREGIPRAQGQPRDAEVIDPVREDLALRGHHGRDGHRSIRACGVEVKLLGVCIGGFIAPASFKQIERDMNDSFVLLPHRIEVDLAVGDAGDWENHLLAALILCCCGVRSSGPAQERIAVPGKGPVIFERNLAAVGKMGRALILVRIAGQCAAVSMVNSSVGVSFPVSHQVCPAADRLPGDINAGLTLSGPEPEGITLPHGGRRVGGRETAIERSRGCEQHVALGAVSVGQEVVYMLKCALIARRQSVVPRCFHDRFRGYLRIPQIPAREGVASGRRGDGQLAVCRVIKHLFAGGGAGALTGVKGDGVGVGAPVCDQVCPAADRLPGDVNAGLTLPGPEPEGIALPCGGRRVGGRELGAVRGHCAVQRITRGIIRVGLEIDHVLHDNVVARRQRVVAGGLDNRLRGYFPIPQVPACKRIAAGRCGDGQLAVCGVIGHLFADRSR